MVLRAIRGATQVSVNSSVAIGDGVRERTHDYSDCDHQAREDAGQEAVGFFAGEHGWVLRWYGGHATRMY